MQAVKAYYDEGKFVPFQPIKIPKGSHAIVTILDFSIDGMDDKCRRQLEALKRFREGMRACDEPVPDFERIKLREVEV